MSLLMKRARFEAFRLGRSKSTQNVKSEDVRGIVARVAPQPFIGLAALTVALGALGIEYRLNGGGSAHFFTFSTLLLAGCLLAAVVPAHRFPVHLRHNTKLYVCTVPLYLMAVLLPTPVGILSVGLGIAGGQLLVRSQRGTKLHDIATESGRWMLLAYLGSSIAHLQVPVGGTLLGELPLLGAALVLLAGDFLSCPLMIAPLSKQSPRKIIVATARQAALPESAQYFVGMLAGLVVTRQGWALVLLTIPTVLLYIAFKKEMSTDTFKLLEGMADAVDLRDPYTGGHSKRVAEFTKGILRELRMNGPESRLIATAARLHDIGKIGVPDYILKKDGILSPEERMLIDIHPDQGADLLARYSDFSRGVEIVRHHHERWDGDGYPHKTSGLDIPFGARVISVADSFDAMTTDRPYRNALSWERAAAILVDGRNRQWDPRIVDAFLRSIANQLKYPVQPLGLHVVVNEVDERGVEVTA